MNLKFCLACGGFQYITFHTGLPGKIFVSNTVQYIYNILINCMAFFLKCGYAYGDVEHSIHTA